MNEKITRRELGCRSKRVGIEVKDNEDIFSNWMNRALVSNNDVAERAPRARMKLWDWKLPVLRLMPT